MSLQSKEKDHSTEELIKRSAKKIFQEKGFAATRTRDIAEEAGINLALLNYYFRSKQKLFDLIMLETLQEFIQSISVVFNDRNSTLEEKIEAFAHRYIDFLLGQPNIPLFILNEIKGKPEHIIDNVPMKSILLQSHFTQQYEKAVMDEELPQLDFMHFLMNLIALTVFPFIASPLLKPLGGISNERFREMMLERKKLIPKWIGLLKAI
ncbi:TetR/AcrR family transcriptional regulator [Echinicola shivajiensis]|uniref:TetR/AcrR family transcriptional regulator n=1 Tax=Echinicola shivajiensis TaxID=1035916 RepID=UPI001BFC4464|nr:TetR/AcrR family transcriptional regulator [Echinicola shivajiensis]